MRSQASLANALHRAARALQQGRASEAQASLEQLEAAFPDHPDRLQLLGLARKAQGDLEGAEQALRAALAKQPANPAVLNNLGNLLRQRGQPTEAEQAYRRATGLKPEFADGHRNLGILLAGLGREVEAVPALRRAVALRPSDAAAWTMLGRCLWRLEHQEEAIEAFRKALDAHPRHVNAHLGLAHALRALGRASEAEACLKRALDLTPDDPSLLTARAHLAVDQGRLDAAERGYRDVIARRPAHAEAHTCLNELLWQRGERAAYGQSFRDALKAEPDSRVLLAALCKSLAAVADHEGVLEVLAERDAVTGSEPTLLAARARAEAAVGSRAQAMDTFAAALALAPDDANVQLDFAQLAIVQGDYQQAQRALDMVEQQRPDDQLMWACRGVCWSLTDDPRADWLHQALRFVQTFELPCPPGYRSLDEFLVALRDCLSALHLMRHAPTSQTLVGGTQTPGLLLQRGEPELQALRTSLNRVVRDYISSFPEDLSHPLLRRRSERFRFAGSWSVALRSGGFHVNHVHPAGWISSAFYVQVPEDLGTSEEDPRGWIKFGESGLGLGDRERVARLVKPRAGYLTLFPSYTWHGTVPFESCELRITAPFDVVPV